MAWNNDLAALINPNTGAARNLKLATMTGPNSCNVGNLQLTSEDLMFSEHLTKQICTKVSEIAPDGGGTCTDKSTYIPALKSGDIVLVYQISDSKFLIIEKVVSG